MSGFDYGMAMKVAGKLLYWVTSVAWPFVAIFVALVYREPIMAIVKTFTTTGDTLKGLSSRLTKVGSFEFGQHQSSEIATKEEQLASTEVILNSVAGNDPSLEKWIDDCRKAIETNNLSKADDLKEKLIRTWAYTLRARFFDQIANQIFETQVKALRKINAAPSDGRGLRRMHEEHCQAAILANIPVDEIAGLPAWMNFLISNGLVNKGETGPYHITDLGKAFLEYADALGLPHTVKL